MKQYFSFQWHITDDCAQRRRTAGRDFRRLSGQGDQRAPWQDQAGQFPSPHGTATSYVSREQPSIADDPKLTNAFYDAPTVITFFAPKQFLFSVDDCAVAAENMMLAADALGMVPAISGRAGLRLPTPTGRKC